MILFENLKVAGASETTNLVNPLLLPSPLRPPYFFLMVVEKNSKKKNNQRALAHSSVQVQYFPKWHLMICHGKIMKILISLLPNLCWTLKSVYYNEYVFVCPVLTIIGNNLCCFTCFPGCLASLAKEDCPSLAWQWQGRSRARLRARQDTFRGDMGLGRNRVATRLGQARSGQVRAGQCRSGLPPVFLFHFVACLQNFLLKHF